MSATAKEFGLGYIPDVKLNSQGTLGVQYSQSWLVSQIKPSAITSSKLYGHFSGKVLNAHIPQIGVKFSTNSKK